MPSRVPPRTGAEGGRYEHGRGWAGMNGWAGWDGWMDSFSFSRIGIDHDGRHYILGGHCNDGSTVHERDTACWVLVFLLHLLG